MIRAVIRAFGPAPDTVRIEPYEPPPLDGGMVRVRMIAGAINPSDIVTISGAYATRTPLPFVPGFEGVGVVEAVAADVTGLAVGDRVLPVGSAGAWQEVKTAEARWCFRVPDALSDERAATGYINPLTAWVMLNERAVLAPGARVVVNAAGSAIGRILIRMANRRGVEPVALVRSSAAHALLEGLGVAAVLNSSCPDLGARLAEASGGRGYDLALDAVGGGEGAILALALRPGGRMIHYGLLSGQPLPPGLPARRQDVVLEYFWLRNWVHAAGRETMERGLAAVWDLAIDGVAASAIEARYPLPAVTDALVHDGRPGRNGKVLITL
jgi:NADPH:quinone reductase-like Zn-dependent oxidoreductase